MNTIGRRRFLVLGAAAVGTLAVGGLAVGGCSLGGDANAWETIFGDALPGVREVGDQGIASGVVPSIDAAVALLPSDQIEVRVGEGGEVTSVDVPDPDAFVAATQQRVADELDRDDFVSLSGYPITPTEVAVAVVARLSTS